MSRQSGAQGGTPLSALKSTEHEPVLSWSILGYCTNVLYHSTVSGKAATSCLERKDKASQIHNNGPLIYGTCYEERKYATSISKLLKVT